MFTSIAAAHAVQASSSHLPVIFGGAAFLGLVAAVWAGVHMRHKTAPRLSAALMVFAGLCMASPILGFLLTLRDFGSASGAKVFVLGAVLALVVAGGTFLHQWNGKAASTKNLEFKTPVLGFVAAVALVAVIGSAGALLNQARTGFTGVVTDVQNPPKAGG